MVLLNRGEKRHSSLSAGIGLILILLLICRQMRKTLPDKMSGGQDEVEPYLNSHWSLTSSVVAVWALFMGRKCVCQYLYIFH